MANYVAEWYGYPALDMSDTAAESARLQKCPFINGACTKSNGVCSVEVGAQIVTTCPNRLYGEDHNFLREIARQTFSNYLDSASCHSPGYPTLFKGSETIRQASELGTPQVGVFGHGWDHEIKLPPMKGGGARYSVDFTIVCISPDGELLGFTPIEVQTIDTTGSAAKSLDGLKNGRQYIHSTIGMNWENVNKRILPQLITKGLMLQGERLCTSGIYFVTIDPVFDKIMTRLGGQSRFREIPNQPGSITFISYQQDDLTEDPTSTMGIPLPLNRTEKLTISTSDMSLAFISPQNLPPAGAFEKSILSKL